MPSLRTRTSLQFFPEITFALCHNASSGGKYPYPIILNGIINIVQIAIEITTIGTMPEVDLFIICIFIPREMFLWVVYDACDSVHIDASAIGGGSGSAEVDGAHRIVGAVIIWAI